MIIRYPCSSVTYQNIGAVSDFALKQTRWSPKTLKMRDFADRRAKKRRKMDTTPTKSAACLYNVYLQTLVLQTLPNLRPCGNVD